MLGSRSEAERFSRLLVRVRWALPLIVLVLAAGHQGVLSLLLRAAPPGWHPLIQFAVYGFTGIVVAWIGLGWIQRAVERQRRAEGELREAYGRLERTNAELQALHELGRQIADAEDVQQLLAIAARMPIRLLGARGTSVVGFRKESGRAELEITWGLPEAAVVAIRRSLDGGLPAERCRSCRPLTARLTDACPLLTPVSEARCVPGVRQVVCLPLHHGQDRFGVVVAYLEGETPPPQDRVHLLNILATELSAGLEGVRLRSRQMATLYALDRVTQERHDLEQLLDRALAATVSGSGADCGAILLTGDGAGSWQVRAQQGLGDDLHAPDWLLALRVAGEACGAAEPVIAGDWRGGDRMRSFAGVALRAEGQVLGALFLGAGRPGVFVPGAARLLSALAHQIALAVRNVQLYSRLRQLAVLEERFRLSRELHDGLAQTLGSLGLQTDRVQRLLADQRSGEARQALLELRGAIAEAYAEVREATEGLRITTERAGGFLDALREYLEVFGSRTGIAVELASEAGAIALPTDTAAQLLRIAQEALTNVRRHARARRVSVRLAARDGAVELAIADDGVGFDPGLSEGRRHLGLATMRERARALGGQFTIATSPGQGSVVTVRVPSR